MLLEFDRSLAKNYKSQPQIIRIYSESWTVGFAFCPNCQKSIYHYKNNKPVADFYCKNCAEDFELKSKKNTFGKRVSCGDHKKMVERLTSEQNPNFFLLNYNQNYQVTNFLVIPKYFITPSMVERRKILKDRNWVGCNILIDQIPESGKVFYVKNSVIESRDKVAEEWRKITFLKNAGEQKGWIFDIMKCIDKIDKKSFSRQELLSFIPYLATKYPNNKNIEYKISQQLQNLRDNGYLKFTERGNYQLL